MLSACVFVENIFIKIWCVHVYLSILHFSHLFLLTFYHFKINCRGLDFLHKILNICVSFFNCIPHCRTYNLYSLFLHLKLFKVNITSNTNTSCKFFLCKKNTVVIANIIFSLVPIPNVFFASCVVQLQLLAQQSNTQWSQPAGFQSLTLGHTHHTLITCIETQITAENNLEILEEKHLHKLLQRNMNQI